MRSALLASLVVLLHAVPVRAGSNNDVGVVVVGEATMQPQIVAQLESWIRQHGHSLAPAALPPEAINTMVDCFTFEDEGCARKVVELRAKSQFVVFAKVDVKPEAIDKSITLTIYWFDKGRDPIAERRYCERCTEALLRSTADELMAALANTAAKNDGKVKITSNPAGARVTIDGRSIGVTPLEYNVRSGTHEITITNVGHADESRSIDVKRGETAQVDVTLRTDSAVSKNFFPLVLLGTGGALLATGLVLFVMDEDEPKPVGEQKEFYRNTGPLGVGLAVSGLVVGGIGGYLLFRSKHTSAPVASITSEAAYVGWTGTF